MGQPTIIEGDLTKNRVVKDGDLIVRGNVGPNVRITVQNGGVEVTGNVGDNVTITQDKNNGGVSASSSGSGSPVFVGSEIKGDLIINTDDDTPGNGSPVFVDSKIKGKVIVNGDKVTVDDKPYTPKAAGIWGVTIKGNVGNNTAIESGNSLRIAGVTGDNVRLKAGNSIEAGKVGAEATLNAVNSINTTCVGSGVSINAGSNAKANRCP